MFFLKKIITTFFFSGVFAAQAMANVVNIVVPFPPGGTNDILGRYVSTVLENAKISSIVINKGGAGGIIGVRHVLDSQDKNNTLLMLSGGPGLFTPLLANPRPYDVRKDLQPVALIATDSVVIIVPTASTIKTAQDLVKSLKSNPGKLSWAHPSMLNKFSGIMFLDRTQTTANEVPYNGGAQTALAVAGGHVDFAVTMFADVKELVTAGKVRILGVADNRRHIGIPSVPTFKEQGIDFEHYSWYAVMAPMGMSHERIQYLGKLIVDAVKKDNDNPVLNKVLVPVPVLSDGLARFLDRQYQIWQPIVDGSR